MKITIIDAIEDYLTYITYNDNKSSNTIKSYRLDLLAYQKYLHENNIIYFSDISYKLVMNYLTISLNSKKNSSISRSKSAIRELHKYISYKHEIKDVTTNITVSQSMRSLPIYCSIDEINIIMNSFDDNNLKELLDHSILELIYGCGLRVSEATNLTISEVNLESKFLNVIGKGDKQRIVPIPDRTFKVIQKYFLNARPLWKKGKTNLFFINHFGKHITKEHVEKKLKEVCKKNQLSNKITPHKLRHSYATHLLANGADLRVIQKLLGHQDITTTEIYTHVDKNKLLNDYRNYFKPVKKDK